MQFKKISITKNRTLNAVFSNNDGDTITMVGGNVVHRDLREAFRALVPHLALLTEQKEAYLCTLDELKAQEYQEGNTVFSRIGVSGVTITEQEVMITGSRILERGGVIQLNSPKVNIEDSDSYEYYAELSLAIEAVKYEAELYIKEKKWGLKEGTLNFEQAGDPFADGMEAGEVPTVTVETSQMEKPKKKKKEKKTA